MEFLKDAEAVYADCNIFDLIDEGHAEPEELLVPEDAKKVLEAYELLNSFDTELEEAGLKISM